MKSSSFVTVLGLMTLSFLMGYFMSTTMEEYPLEGKEVNVRRGTDDFFEEYDERPETDKSSATAEDDVAATRDLDPHEVMEPSFLPLQPWEWPGTCGSRPSHIPEYCCYGGVEVFRNYCQKFEKSTVEKFANYSQHYLEKKYDFFHATTHSPSPCNECEIANYMLKHNLTVTFVGDSVIDQTWVGLDCSLRRRGYRFESKTIIGWNRPSGFFWKYGLQDHRVLKLVGGPHGITGEARLVYIKSYRRPTYGEEFFHVIRNTDVFVFDHGLHWQPKFHEEFRSEMVEYLKHFRTPEAAHIRLVAWRETSAQHWNYPGGHFVPGIETKTEECMPIQGNFLLPDDDPRGYQAYLMKNATAEAGLTFRNAMLPNFTQQSWTPFELVMLPFREFVREVYYNHPHAGDCTHMCNTPLLWHGVWQSLRLAMDRAFGPHPSIGKGFGDLSEGNFTKVVSTTIYSY